MHHLFRQLWSHLRCKGVAYVVLLVAMVPALLSYQRVREFVASRADSRFERSATEAREAVRERLLNYLADLRAVTGFFEASQDVSEAEWVTFINALKFGEMHVGTRSVGYAELVSAETRDDFIRRLQPRVAKALVLSPATNRDLMVPTVYVRQYPTNMDALVGWDNYQHRERRQTIDYVIESGLPGITGRIPYMNPGQGRVHGFTVYLPVLNGQQRVRGLVFSSFIPQDLLADLGTRGFGSSLRVELLEQGGLDQSGLLATWGHDQPEAGPGHQSVQPIQLMGRTFLVRITGLTLFVTPAERQLPAVALLAGVAISLLLFVITWVQAGARASAERLNGRLRDSEERLQKANAELHGLIAEARATEKLLSHERDLLRTLLDSSPDRIYFKDKESRFTKCSFPVVQRMGIRDVSGAVGKTDFDFFDPLHARRAFEMEQEIMRSGRPVIGIVEREIWLDGHECWVLTAKMPLRDKDGAVIGTFGISKDITQLKAAERALEQEKDLLAVTLRSIADGVITTDVDGRVVLMNEAAAALCAFPQPQAVGQPVQKILPLTEDTLTPALGVGGAPVLAREAVLATPAGQKSISYSVAPIIDWDGRRAGLVVVFRDITEKLKTEAELLKASKLESIGVLAGGIAHDFNNILTVILGNISLARASAGLGLSADEQLNHAEEATGRARELTQRLLTFAKGGAPIKKAVDVARLVRDCARRVLDERGVEPQFFMSNEPWAAAADEAQIAQVLQNLFAYVLATMQEDRRLDVHVLNQEIQSDPLLLLKPGRYVRVSIRDYGTGVQPEQAARIFDPYFGATKKQGTGLELATAYSIVRKHDGQIRVESISGQGTIFHVYLPAQLEGNPSVAEMGSPSVSRFGPRRILVMDDEPGIRRLAVLLLQRLGHLVECASDGVQAIQKYRDASEAGNGFDLVIMDLTVAHGMGGVETLRQLREYDPAVQAIVSSGYSNDPVMADYRSYGFVGVVPKPYTAEQLAACLNGLFSQSDPGLA